jgi:hypothetical protein
MVKTPLLSVAVVPVEKFKVPAVPRADPLYCTANALAVDTAYGPTYKLVAVTIPPTFRLPPMPTPPTTCSAPEFVPVLAVAFDTTNVAVVPVVAVVVPPLENTAPFSVTVPVELKAKV